MKQVLAVCGTSERFEAQPYENALRQAGIEPQLIRPSDRVPEDFAGLLLMGGTDVNPATYNEARGPHTDSPDDARDALELMLIGKALDHDVPILAICRGLQILNVQHGGTLQQHLEPVDRHRILTPEDRGKTAHSVEIVPGTKLADIVGEPLTLNVNSRHHQAIDKLGNGLRISAQDPQDDIIEGVERPDKRFVVGVQWHPENIAAQDAREARLFAAFAAAL